MRRLVYSKQARRDIAEIFSYIAETGGNRSTATRFIASLRAKCAKMASLDTMLGRQRAFSGEEVRSTIFGSYLIFLRYDDDLLQIVRIIERHRDVAAQLDDTRD